MSKALGPTMHLDGGVVTTATLAAMKQAVNQNAPYVPVTVPGDATLNAHLDQLYVLNKGSAAAITLGAPTSGVDDGTTIIVTSNTAFAHVITATGLLQDGAGHQNTVTFAANAGGGVTLMAYAGKWIVIASQNVTIA